jgi:hypothetical protein
MTLLGMLAKGVGEEHFFSAGRGGNIFPLFFLPFLKSQAIFPESMEL